MKMVPISSPAKRGIKRERLLGMMSFDCIYRRLEVDDKQVVKEYGSIFQGFPSIGLCSYGEINIGYMNQTSTMLILKREQLEPNDSARGHMFCCDEHGHWDDENERLQMKIAELEQKLAQATDELRLFNRLLEEEMSEKTKKEEQITYLSYHDELTGLHNRRYYAEALMTLDQQKNLPISIIVADVNNLKITNDTLGHAKGDELLIEAARVMRSVCRQKDIIARIGGDEFVILLPNTSSDSAENIVRRIETLAENKTVGDCPLSISFGWDTKEALQEDILDRLSGAEGKMYKNKAAQRGGGR